MLKPTRYVRALSYSKMGSQFPQPSGDIVQELVEIYEEAPFELDALHPKQLRLIQKKTHKYISEGNLARCRLLLNPEELEEVVTGMKQHV